MGYDNDFIDIFNTYYPFERYIVKNPRSIGCRFDDVLMEEIFIPSTEIALEKTDSGDWYLGKIDYDEIYIKLKGNAGETRLGYFDFESHIRENIREIIYEDFGKYEWQGLYVEYEDDADYQQLLEALNIQYKLIKEKYGKCNVKSNCLNQYEIKDGKVVMNEPDDEIIID